MVLKILVGVGLGFLLFTNPEARQITADLLRATAAWSAPEEEVPVLGTDARKEMGWASEVG